MPSELDAFRAFLGQQIQVGQDDLTPEEALFLWSNQHPDAASEDATAEIQEALTDLANGDRGRLDLACAWAGSADAAEKRFQHLTRNCVQEVAAPHAMAGAPS